MRNKRHVAFLCASLGGTLLSLNFALTDPELRKHSYPVCVTLKIQTASIASFLGINHDSCVRLVLGAHHSLVQRGKYGAISPEASDLLIYVSQMASDSRCSTELRIRIYRLLMQKPHVGEATVQEINRKDAARSLARILLKSKLFCVDALGKKMD